MIDNYRRQFPKDYLSVNKKINAIDEQIGRMINGLNSNEYKRTIAEVVTKDFGDIIRQIRQNIQSANSSYREGMGSIEYDRTKMAKISQSLHNIYFWRAREPGLRVSDDRDDLKTSRITSKKKIFDQRNTKMAMT